MSDLDLLAIGAHPDDAELSCGGWLALTAQRGQAAAILDLTRGELATNGTPEVRAAEALAAGNALGVARHNLGLPDGGVDDRDPAQLEALVGAIRTHRPRLLLAPWTQARHPDHAAAGRLAARAHFFAGLAKFAPVAGAPFRPQRLLFYPQRKELRPSFVVDTSATHAIKARAVACYASQFGAGDPTLINQPLGLEAFVVRDRYWGATIGVSHGEPYLIAGPLPLSDPIAHFSAHPAPPVLET